MDTDLTLESKKKKRIRLSPEVRRIQILDAALIEFSSLGYTAASISKIAQRAGMSKANLYVHFKNKDEIFETLLSHVLTPSKSDWLSINTGSNIEEVIDQFIDRTYDGLNDHMISVIRLLISESHRIPDLIQKWYKESVLPFKNDQFDLISNLVDSGKIQKSPLTQDFSFNMAPILYAAVSIMFFNKEMSEQEVKRTKETHRKLLHLLIKK
ncbi:TetR/AcrR family transcriptional regulator [Acinetobacter baumannii]|uniref:TetR/AcrR family transcriptional regulator n=1 Tax=Acinetobacter baumannii TaxID=470 RepID=UPI00244BA5F1|nr:TetR/AcrR family transcriptional regulator [Acinetobacter baumannii]MDH2498734.1 TetR/AcrR family transcriptional regulator [Acinetobacter baumannii]